MPSLIVCTGFEIGDTKGWATGNNANRYVDFVDGSPTFVADDRTGTTDYCLELSSTTAAENIAWDQYTIGASHPVLVFSFWVKFPTARPSVTTRLCKPESSTANGTGFGIIQYNPKGTKFEAQVAAGTIRSGPTVNADQLYLIEGRWDASGT